MSDMQKHRAQLCTNTDVDCTKHALVLEAGLEFTIFSKPCIGNSKILLSFSTNLIKYKI